MGHLTSNCYAKTDRYGALISNNNQERCNRCKRIGHQESDCYAKTTISGEEIDIIESMDAMFRLMKSKYFHSKS